MREHEQRYTPARLLLRRAVLIALLVLFVAMAQGAWHAYLKERETKAGRNQAETELNHLRDRHTELEGKVDHLKTDQGVEQELREQFSVGRPGEQLIIVVDPASDTRAAVPPEQKSWWQRFLNL